MKIQDGNKFRIPTLNDTQDQCPLQDKNYNKQHTTHRIIPQRTRGKYEAKNNTPTEVHLQRKCWQGIPRSDKAFLDLSLDLGTYMRRCIGGDLSTLRARSSLRART